MDIEAIHSLLQKPLKPLIYQTIEVQGTTGNAKEYKWTIDWTANVGLLTCDSFFNCYSLMFVPFTRTGPLDKLQTTLSFWGNSPMLRLEGPAKALTIYNLSNKWGISASPKFNPFPEGGMKKLLIQEITTVWGREQSSWLSKMCATHHNETSFWGNAYLSQIILYQFASQGRD